MLYEDLLKSMNKDLGVVIYLDIDKEELKERVCTRLICNNCKRSYSTREKIFMPLEEGVCDKCKRKLIKREDDKEEIFLKRYEEYMKLTTPLIDYYDKKGVLIRSSYHDTLSIFEEVYPLVINND